MTEQKTTVEKVMDFHKTFEHPIGTLIDQEPLKIRQLRIKLIFEELKELAEAGDVMRTLKDICTKEADEITIYHDGDNVNKVEELDAISDIQYVLDGKKLTSGLYEVTDKAFDLVHQNNMSKAHRSKEHVAETVEKIGIPLTAILRNDVWIAINSDGKVIKPHDHKKVTLNHLIQS